MARTRGVTGPMAQSEAEASPAGDDRDEALRRHHRLTLWIPWTLILLGVWMVLAPVTLGHLTEKLWAVPSGGRGVWFGDATHDELRAWLVVWSDVFSGLLLAVVGWRALRPVRPVSWWVACGVGVWLVFAPIVLWSPSAAAFANDSVVGCS